MPMQKTKSALASKLGTNLAKAVEAHREDEIVLGGGGDLPDGIEGGIAQLVECKFDVYKEGDNKGEYYFYAAGVVVSPDEHDGIPIKGLRTSVMEPVCDTPSRSRKNIDEHVAWVLNELRKLGINTADLDVDDLEDTATALKEAKPYFRFRTWKGKPTSEFPNPRINHDWRGIVEGYVADSDETAGVVDETEEAESVQHYAFVLTAGGVEAPWVADDLNEKAAAADSGDDEAAQAIANQAAQVDIDPEEYDTWADVVAAIQGASNKVNEQGEISLQDHGLLADEDGDDDSISALTTAAEKAGLNPDEYESWLALVDALAEGRATAAEDTEIQKGDVYMYKPPKARKAVECEVTAVFTGKRTCNLRNLDDGKSYKAVAWDALESA